MKLRFTLPAGFLRSAIIISCGSALVSLGQTAPPAPPQPAQSEVMTTTAPANDLSTPKLPNEELDALVAPIALYSDPLLAQTLAASTYPLEVIQLQQWMNNNKNLKGKALADAVAKLPYDPSVQSMAGVPDALQRMAGNISWTTDLGNAFLAQQQDVMDAVQRMRAKAQGTGALKTSQQQVVETKTVEGGKQVIVVEQPSQEVVYVPSYDPAVVYGPAPYAYPYYPYTYSGYYAGMGLAFGTGIILGAAWGNNWGNCNWGGGDININRDNNFNRNTNINRGQGGKNNWQHNPKHRGSAPYGDRGTANRYGGNARQRQGGASNRPSGGAGIANRPGGGAGANRPGGGAGANRPGGGAGANRPGGGTGASRPGGGAGASRPSGGANRGSAGGGANRVGNHSVSSRPSSSSRGGGFGGGGGGGSYSRASSSRGGHSMGGGGYSRGGGGGFSRGGGGGGRGGGGRGGGGGRRR